MGQYNSQIQSSLGSVYTSPTTVSVTDSTLTEIGGETILAAQPAVLTVRTSNSVGTLTMDNADHGITTGMRIDMYFSGGQRYGVLVGTVAGTSVPFTVGGGTNLPIATTAIVVGIPVEYPLVVDGDDISAALLATPTLAPAMYTFATDVPADVLNKYVTSSFEWYTGSGITNPFAALDIASVWISHSDTAADHTDVRAGFLYH